MSRKIDLEDYIDVRERVEMFWEKHPNGALKTELIHSDERTVQVYAAAFSGYTESGPLLIATGLAEEKREGFVNKDSAVENCETSAIGRCLANAGFATRRGPSKQEMAKVKRLEESRGKKVDEIPMEPATPLDVLKDEEAKELAGLVKDWIGSDDKRKAAFKLKVVELGVVEPNKRQLWQVVQQLSPANAAALNKWMGEQGE